MFVSGKLCIMQLHILYSDFFKIYIHILTIETLRVWPPVIGVDRICVKPYFLSSPNENDISTNYQVSFQVYILI